MSKSPITVNVRMDGPTFRRFAHFDTYVLRRKAAAPAVFCAILLAFSAVAFLLRGSREDAALIGWVLLSIGVLLPFCYFLHFELQLRAQTRRLGLKTPRPAYFVSFTDEGVRVVNNMIKEEALILTWTDVHAVYRRRDAFYLYHTENRAFILPLRDASCTGDTLQDFFAAHLPKEKLHA